MWVARTRWQGRRSALWLWLGLAGVGWSGSAAAEPGLEPGDAAPTPPAAQTPAPSTASGNAGEPERADNAIAEGPGEDGEADGSDDAPAFGAVAVVPTPGVVQQLAHVPRNVQVLDQEQLGQGRPLSLADSLQAQLGSVTLNDVQSNPLQRDLSYRGFTASPLLGTPQGIAVYQNGVRINEPFGDVLQWDVMPEFAIAKVQLLPGANPVYGLNALGGSLAIRTKNGFDQPGHAVSVLAGSFARYRTRAETGHDFGKWALYAGADAFGEEGFRDESRSSAQHLLADLRTRDPKGEVGAVLTLANTDLNGNGPTPVELLRRDWSSLYTYPDNTSNRLLMLSLDGQRSLARELSVQGTAYLRAAQRDTLNGDEAEFALCPSAVGMLSGQQVLCDDDGTAVLSEGGQPIALTAAYDGLFNTSTTVATGMGGSLALSVERPLWSLPSQFVVGGSYDGAFVDFEQRAEAGYLTRRRSVAPVGVYLGGEDFQTDLAVRNHYFGAYVSETLNPWPELALNLAARLNWASLRLRDGLSSALDGDHRFTRVNPTFGLAYTPIPALTFFSSYGEGNRTPSAAELSCADPDAPCRVPNAFIADPPLKQVVTRAIEAGLRGQHGDRDARLRWSFASYFARNQDDIIFVAGSRVGTGYFRNAGSTQRMGLEANLSGQLGPVDFYFGYGLLRATFENALTLPNNLASDDDDDEGDGAEAEQHVRAGDRIPNLPRHSAKAGVRVWLTDGLQVGVGTIAQGNQRYRGDEAGRYPALPGFVVVNLDARYDVLDGLRFLAKVNNLLDARYATFGVIADPSEVVPSLSDPRFQGPSAPFGVWLGAEVY